MFGRKKENVEKLSGDQRDAKVLTELGEVKKCVEKGDVKCTVKHLQEARRFEDCSPCKRVMTSTANNAPQLTREQLERKVSLLSEYVEPASRLKKTYREMKSIKPPRGTVFRQKTRNAVTKVGGAVRKTGSRLADLLKS